MEEVFFNTQSGKFVARTGELPVHLGGTMAAYNGANMARLLAAPDGKTMLFDTEAEAWAALAVESRKA